MEKQEEIKKNSSGFTLMDGIMTICLVIAIAILFIILYGCNKENIDPNVTSFEVKINGTEDPMNYDLNIIKNDTVISTESLNTPYSNTFNVKDNDTITLQIIPQSYLVVSFRRIPTKEFSMDVPKNDTLVMYLHKF